MKPYVIGLLLSAIVMSSGCSVPERVRGHILQPTDRALPAYQNNLVILDVRVKTDQGALKLNDVDLRDTATGLPWHLPLFSNSIMKTNAVPFEEKDDAIHHTIVVDLPAATYEVTTLEFKDHIVNLIGTNVVQVYEQRPPEPLYFEVTDSPQPQYLGTLELTINPYLVSESRDGTSQMMSSAHSVQTANKGLDPGGTDAILGAASTAMATDVQTLSGTLLVNVVGPDDASARSAGKRFRALTGTTVTRGRMWLQSESGQSR